MPLLNSIQSSNTHSRDKLGFWSYPSYPSIGKKIDKQIHYKIFTTGIKFGFGHTLV